MVTQHMMRRPESIMAAQYSLPFTIATSLINNPGEYESYTDKQFNDESILAICDIVDAEEDMELEGAFPEHFGSWIEIVTKDGKSKDRFKTAVALYLSPQELDGIANSIKQQIDDTKKNEKKKILLDAGNELYTDASFEGRAKFKVTFEDVSF